MWAPVQLTIAAPRLYNLNCARQGSMRFQTALLGLCVPLCFCAAENGMSLPPQLDDQVFVAPCHSLLIDQLRIDRIRDLLRRSCPVQRSMTAWMSALTRPLVRYHHAEVLR